MNRRPILILSAVAIATALGLYLGNDSSAPVISAPPTSTPLPKDAPTPVTTVEPTPSLLAEVQALGPKPAPTQRMQLIEKLAALGPGHEAELASAIVEARTPAQRSLIATALARLGTSEAVDALMGLIISSPNADERKDILPALDALPPGPAIETLASSLALKLEPSLLQGVIATIARTADERIVTYLHELYREPEAFAGQVPQIGSALSSIRNPAAASALRDLLRTTGDATLLQHTAHALSNIGTPDSLQPIADTLRRIGPTNPELRQQLITSVQSVSNIEAMTWLERTAADKTDADLARAARYALNSLTTIAR